MCLINGNEKANTDDGTPFGKPLPAPKPEPQPGKIAFGHWYCSCCNEVIHMRRPISIDDRRTGEKCPVCHNRSATWVVSEPRQMFSYPRQRGGKAAPVSPEIAAEKFDAIKKDLQ